MATKKAEAARMGRPSELTGGLAELAEAMGGIENLSRAMGVTSRTIQRWNSGDLSPREPARRMLEMLAKQHKVTKPFETKEIPEIVLRAGERELLLVVAGAPRGKIRRDELLRKLDKAMGGIEEKTTFVNYVNALVRAELIARTAVDEESEVVSLTKAGRTLVRKLPLS